MAKRRGNNEGSIFQRENGNWVAQFRINGQRVSRTFQTAKECRNWIRQMQEQVKAGLTFDGSKITVGEYLTHWLKTIKGALRPKTHYQYEGVVRNHLLPKLDKIRMVDFHASQIQSLYVQLQENGIGKRTVGLVHSILHKAIEDAYRQGLVARNVVSVVQPPRPAEKEMKVLNDNQARELLIAAEGSEFEALFHLAVTTGLRQGELLGLKWGDMDWATGVLDVQRQLQRIPQQGLVLTPPKTKAGRRLIQLGEGGVNKLASHRKAQDAQRIRSGWQAHNLIFPSSVGTPFDPRNLLRAFKNLLKKAGLPDMRFHDLRHTAATLMLLNNVPLMVVSRRLGHSKPSVTLDIYGHYLPGMQEGAATLMDELVTPIATKWQQIGNSSFDPAQIRQE